MGAYNGKPGPTTSQIHPPFEIFEHTADAGVIAFGGSLSQLFEHAALGMFSLMAELAGVREREKRFVRVQSRDRESLLVAWLSELLYHLDSEELLFSRFSIGRFRETELSARVFGERIDRDRHELRLGVKAVTRHMLEIADEDGAYRATILFDI